MKKVTIIFPGWIKAPNGAAQFVFGLRSCINDFANQGIGLSTFTLDDVHGEVRNFSNNDKIKRKASLKNKLMRYAKYSHLMTYAMIYFSGLRYSKRIVEAFDEIPNDELPDIIHFQDLFACYYYLKRKRKNKKSVSGRPSRPSGRRAADRCARCMPLRTRRARPAAACRGR